VLAECDHPVALITKNAMVERDLDLLAQWRRRSWRRSMSRLHIGPRHSPAHGAAPRRRGAGSRRSARCREPVCPPA
jgi:hypothetical protein